MVWWEPEVVLLTPITSSNYGPLVHTSIITYLSLYCTAPHQVRSLQWLSSLTLRYVVSFWARYLGGGLPVTKSYADLSAPEMSVCFCQPPICTHFSHACSCRWWWVTRQQFVLPRSPWLTRTRVSPQKPSGRIYMYVAEPTHLLLAVSPSTTLANLNDIWIIYNVGTSHPSPLTSSSPHLIPTSPCSLKPPYSNITLFPPHPSSLPPLISSQSGLS